MPKLKKAPTKKTTPRSSALKKHASKMAISFKDEFLKKISTLQNKTQAEFQLLSQKIKVLKSKISKASVAKKKLMEKELEEAKNALAFAAHHKLKFSALKKLIKKFETEWKGHVLKKPNKAKIKKTATTLGKTKTKLSIVNNQTGSNENTLSKKNEAGPPLED